MDEDARQQIILAVSAELASRRDELIAEVSRAIQARIRGLDTDARLAELMNGSTTECIISAIHFIGRGDPHEEIQAPPAALTYARALARQGEVPLSGLLRAYRIGHAHFLEWAIRAATPHTDDPAQIIIELTRATALWIDVVCDQVSTAYEQEQVRWVSNQSGLRQQWVARLLAGGTTEIAQAEEVLHYRFEGSHVAAVVWPDSAVPTDEVVNLFDQVKVLLASSVGALEPPLVVPTDEREVRMWFPVPAGASLDARLIRSALGKSGLRIRLTFGEAEPGLDGFRRSLFQAERVKAVALAGTQRAERAITYREVAPLAMMAGDLDCVRRFVVRALGDLATDCDRDDRLRETLREFLSRSRSYSATAESLFLHRNTVQYRVGQAMERCGRDLDDPETALDVQFALHACHWLAPAVLSAPTARR